MADREHRVHLLSCYLEGELSRTEREATEEHIRTCVVCRRELALLHQTVDALQGMPLETTPADFVEKLNRRIEQTDGQRGRCERGRIPAADRSSNPGMVGVAPGAG